MPPPDSADAAPAGQSVSEQFVKEAAQTSATYLHYLKELRSAVINNGDDPNDIATVFKGNVEAPKRSRVTLPTFNGKLADFPTYIQILKMTWRVEHKNGVSDYEFIANMLARLEGDAAKWAARTVESLKEQVSVAMMVRLMQAKYVDPAAASRAKVELRNLKQGRTPLIDHIQRYENLVDIAGWTRMPHDFRIFTLQESLSSEIMEVLYFQLSTMPADYDGWRNKLVEIVQGMVALRQHQTRHDGPNSRSAFRGFSHQSLGAHHSRQSAAPRPAAAASPRPAAAATPVAPATPAARHPDAMDWSRTYAVHGAGGRTKRAVWVDADEIANRRENGLCLRCGASDHRIKFCPFLPARNPNSVRVNHVSGKAVVLPNVIDDDGFVCEGDDVLDLSEN